ncbi:hypothetical protein MMC10_003237 [Thelotrema lepadinum]|nr:hypothetical protein [Thelotrema lepadinum]
MTAASLGTGIPPYITAGPDQSTDYRKRAIVKRRPKRTVISQLGNCLLKPPQNAPLKLPDMLVRAAQILRLLAQLTYLPDEKKWLRQFFTTIIGDANGPNLLSCDQFNQYFLLFNSKCPVNVVQAVWNKVAGTDNLKFVAMSQYLNSNAKALFFPDLGQVFAQAYANDPKYQIPENADGWAWPEDSFVGSRSAKDTLRDMTFDFERVLYGVLEMKADNMLPLIDENNNEIYSALQSVDKLIKDNDDSIFGDTTAYWASFPDGISEAYKNFMNTEILPQINVPPKYLTSLFETAIWPLIIGAYNIPDVGASLKNKNKPGVYKGELDAIQNTFVLHRNAYYVGGKWTWAYEFEFSWTVMAAQKRGQDLSALIKRQQARPAQISSLEQVSSILSSTDPLSTADATPEPPSSATVTSCGFLSTSYPESLPSIVSTAIRNFCQRGTEVAGISIATSGSLSTTYCGMSSLPAGFTQIAATNGEPASSSSSLD